VLLRCFTAVRQTRAIETLRWTHFPFALTIPATLTLPEITLSIRCRMTLLYYPLMFRS